MGVIVKDELVNNIRWIQTYLKYSGGTVGLNGNSLLKSLYEVALLIMIVCAKSQSAHIFYK